MVSFGFILFTLSISLLIILIAFFILPVRPVFPRLLMIWFMIFLIILAGVGIYLMRKEELIERWREFERRFREERR